MSILQYLEARPPGASRPGLRGASNSLKGTLILIHAFPLSARMWEPQLGLAEQGWRIVAPQLRGFGGTPASSVASSVDEYAADIIDLLDHLHIENAVVAGLSLGGYIMFAMFRHAPGYFHGMVLADTRAQPDPPQAIEGRKHMIEAVRAGGTAAAADEMLPKLVCDWTRTHRPEVVAGLREMMLENPSDVVAGAITALMTRPDSRPLLPTVRCPTLVIVGDQDAITPPPMSEEMQQLIPGAELAVIPDAGHMSNMEQPERFNSALARFLERRV